MVHFFPLGVKVLLVIEAFFPLEEFVVLVTVMSCFLTIVRGNQCCFCQNTTHSTFHSIQDFLFFKRLCQDFLFDLFQFLGFCGFVKLHQSSKESMSTVPCLLAISWGWIIGLGWESVGFLSKELISSFNFKPSLIKREGKMHVN